MSGGGAPGAAWMVGMLDGFCAGGIDLGEADLIVGTSAGALAGAPLAGGMLEEAVTIYQGSRAPFFRAPVTSEEFMAAAARVGGTARDPEEAIRALANLDPIGSGLASHADAASLFAAFLPSAAWPEQLVITAVDSDSAHRATFDANSRVQLLDAVRASCAVPGVFPSVTICGRRYADGGLRSPFNADLAAGHGVVVLLSPLRINGYVQHLLEAEIASLDDATVHVIVADEASLAAIGPDLLSTETAEAAVNAGREQAARDGDALRSVWQA
jgi:NTE family protein